jgi:hypothetical protein
MPKAKGKELPHAKPQRAQRKKIDNLATEVKGDKKTLPHTKTRRIQREKLLSFILFF